MTTPLTPEQEALLAVWQQHTYAEFVLKDPDAALATMTDNPYVWLIPAGTGGAGRAGVREFYANHFIPNVPPDLEFVPISQIFGSGHIVEESVVRFTHSIAMDWMLPGVPPTGRKAEFVMVGVIRVEGGKVAHEHLYWDQATLLTQLGIVDNKTAAGGTQSAAKLLELVAQAKS